MIAQAETYPSAERQSCGFGIRFIKALMASDAILLHGADVVSFAVWVASIEDRLKYRMPIALWRKDISDKFGFHRNEATASLLKRVAESGLVYRVPLPNGSREQMTFWVTVPEWLTEFMQPSTGSANGTGDSPTGSENGTGGGTGGGTGNGTLSTTRIPVYPIHMPESNSGVTVQSKPKRKQSTVEGFDQWYQSYPRKVAPKVAEKAYGKAVGEIAKAKRVSASEAVAMLAAWTAERLPGLLAIEEKFRPYPATWLNDGRYRDEIVHKPDAKTNGYKVKVPVGATK